MDFHKICMESDNNEMDNLSSQLSLLSNKNVDSVLPKILTSRTKEIENLKEHLIKQNEYI